MQSHFINYFFTNELMQALFRTLMHSLWQGILLASIAGLIILYTKNSGAVLRYKLFSGVLLTFIFISLATFCYELYSVTSNAVPVTKAITLSAYNNAVTHKPSPSNLVEKIISGFKSAENFIVLTWFIIIMLKSISLLTGLRSVYILKHRQVSNAGEYWNEQLKQLAAKAGVTKKVILLKSAIAKIPMVLGHLKPVILFPAAALTTLPPEEIEAILLHELAHIRRKDYLVNILQSLAEIIFFFNPAVLWISSLIKEERENCCDDIAITQIKNKKQFVHALVSFQEYNLTSKYAATFSGKRNHLLNRIKRIITNNNKTLTNMEKTFLAAGIIITSLMAVAFAQHKQFSYASFMPPAKTSSLLNKKDTVPVTANDNESKYTMSSTMDGKQYRLVEVNGKVTELYVDNVRVPDDKISDYNSVIDKLQTKMKADKEAQKEAMEAQKETLKAQSEAMKESMRAQKEEIHEQAEKLQEQAAELREEMENDSDKLQGRVEAIKDQAALLQQKALAMSDIKNQVATAQLEALKATQDGMKKEILAQVQAEKLASLINDSDMINAEKFAKLSELIQDQTEKQSKIIKDKTEKTINEELKKQIEQLKQQNEELKQQIKQKVDSIYKSNLNKPQGA
ncbi:MAG TPA: M56 family metallopeptidase [Parafilimonas sp.]